MCLMLALAAWNSWATGGEPRRLTTDGQLKTSPVFTDRSGDELIYVVEDLPSRMRLMRLRLADGKIEPVHPDENRAEFEPAFTPDGRKLAFVQSRGNLNLVLVIQDLDAGKETTAPVGSGFAGPRSPCFTADGSQVLFSFAEEGRQQIYALGLSDIQRRTLIDSPGVNNWPTVSPDGKQLAFASTRDGDYDLYLAQIDGTGPRRIEASRGQDIRPRFSPDGRRVAFTSARDGNYEIYVINVDGSGLQRITRHEERDDYAEWHPSGRQLVIVSERAGKHDLYLVDVP